MLFDFFGVCRLSVTAEEMFASGLPLRQSDPFFTGVFRMGSKYQYFTIPFDSVPQQPAYTVWFSVPANDTTGVVWTTTRPTGNVTNATTWAIGASDDQALPASAQLLGFSTKCIPPPPLA